MQRQTIIIFIASIAAAAIGYLSAPISAAFVLAACICGALYVVLRFCLWTPKAEWLPTLAQGLAVLGGMRVTIRLLYPGIPVGSRGDWLLGLAFVGTVGVVVFGYRIVYGLTKTRQSL